MALCPRRRVGGEGFGEHGEYRGGCIRGILEGQSIEL